MKLGYANNPMYALCLLAAVCVRQHVQNGKVQPLTKSVSLQKPTTVLMKPNKASLKTANDTDYAKPDIKPSNTNYPNLQEANALLACVQNFTKRAEKFDDILMNIPLQKPIPEHDTFITATVPDWMVYIFSNISVKWFA